MGMTEGTMGQTSEEINKWETPEVGGNGGDN